MYEKKLISSKYEQNIPFEKKSLNDAAYDASTRMPYYQTG